MKELIAAIPTDHPSQNSHLLMDMPHNDHYEKILIRERDRVAHLLVLADYFDDRQDPRGSVIRRQLQPDARLIRHTAISPAHERIAVTGYDGPLLTATPEDETDNPNRLRLDRVVNLYTHLWSDGEVREDSWLGFERVTFQHPDVDAMVWKLMGTWRAPDRFAGTEDEEMDAMRFVATGVQIQWHYIDGDTRFSCVGHFTVEEARDLAAGEKKHVTIDFDIPA